MSYYKEIQNFSFADGGYILLPSDESKKYPVVYMFHGISGVEEWKAASKANIAVRMEKVVAEGGAQSIIVMPRIRCAASVEENADIEEIMLKGAYDQFFNYDICGLIDYINSKYEQYVLKGKENTAIAGFSMGATAAIYHAVRNRNIINNMGAVSIAVYTFTKEKIKPEDFVLDNEKNAIHYIGYGTAEVSGFVDADQYCINSFRNNNVAVKVETNSGTGHKFSTFNPLLESFLKMIFKS